MIRARLVLRLVFALGAVGCQGIALPEPPTEEVRASLGRIGVVIADAPTRYELDAPASRGFLGGLLGGFGRGWYMLPQWILAGGGNSPFVPFVAAAFGILYIPFSTLGGVVTAANADQAERAQGVIDRVLADAKVQARLGDLTEAWVGRATGRPASRPTLAQRETVDTVLEVAVPEIGRGSTWGFWTVNHPFEIRVGGSVRLLRVRDGAELYAVQMTHANPRVMHTHAEWAELDRGRALAEALDGALDALAEQFVEEIFLRHRRPELPREWLPDNPAPSPQAASTP